jgi:osmotically-inducible protein OsmY
MTNSELESRIRGGLGSNPELKAARLLIDTDAGHRTVTISGTVESDEVHAKAIETAQSAVPGITVVDKVQVQPSDLARADQEATPPAPEAKAKGRAGKPARRR